MQILNASILGIPIPDRMKRRPISDKGFPVPWFVANVNGLPDFRVADPDKLVMAVKRKLCWLCGEPIGVHMVFVLGPMCSVNRTSAEPPCHLECADYAVRACPFLTKPGMRRNEKDLPEESQEPGGTMIKRNPGVTGLWITKSYKVFRAPGGALFQIGDPERVLWFAQGRTATRAEVEASIESGMPILLKVAEDEGPGAVSALYEHVERARAYLPAAGS